jgi:DNA-binding MarR family transcriptional regulator
MSQTRVARPVPALNYPIAISSGAAVNDHRNPFGPCGAEVRKVIAAREARFAIFGAHLFGDPGWDILLELYAAHLEQRRHTIGTLCDAVPVPPTTILRWITTLEAESLVKRANDPMDARRVFVVLKSSGRSAMHRFFCVQRAEIGW